MRYKSVADNCVETETGYRIEKTQNLDRYTEIHTVLDLSESSMAELMAEVLSNSPKSSELWEMIEDCAESVDRTKTTETRPEEKDAPEIVLEGGNGITYSYSGNDTSNSFTMKVYNDGVAVEDSLYLEIETPEHISIGNVNAFTETDRVEVSSEADTDGRSVSHWRDTHPLDTGSMVSPSISFGHNTPFPDRDVREVDEIVIRAILDGEVQDTITYKIEG